MSRRIKSAAALIAGACLVWGGSNLHGQTVVPPEASAVTTGTAAAARAARNVPAVAAAVGTDSITFAPTSLTPGAISTGALSSGALSSGALSSGALSSGALAPGVMVPGVPAVEGESVAAIPLPPSAYPGMVGLATAALAGWRFRRRRR
jgi:hypothetical protein